MSKVEKELFVSNLTGSSIEDTTTLLFVGLGLYMLWSIMSVRKIIPSGFLGWLVQFFIFAIIPLLVSVNRVFPSVVLVILLFIPSIVLLLMRDDSPKHARNIQEKHHKPDTWDKRMSISPCFHANWAKVETWGTSLMDLGVGSFMFSSGMVAGRKNSMTEKGAFRSVLRNALVMFVLGFIRLVTTKGLEYQEHVTEYGVHWNFFFTLGSLAIGVYLLRLFLLRWSYFWLATLATVVHHVFLTWTPLQQWALTAPRTNLLAQNKEGIVSIPGYVALFLYGMETGKILLQDRPAIYTKAHAWARTQKLVIRLVAVLVFYQLSKKMSVGISRRLANMPYVQWVVGTNMLFLCFYTLWDGYIFPPKATYQTRVASLLRQLNDNGLFVFLLGNLFTGAVNMTVDTLRCGLVKGLAIMTLYLFVICYIVRMLSVHNIRIRF
ncbi:pig-W [Schizosaccharomyces japonicus yFS275]|uniref:GPI-anchored wall transfer protein n=1 Tax=Schizosaccharomyces japonicus (strain yFS275 / FY16936) TaxID=402676 RepID=B6JUW9_SCHJY|nr:pig-W [Schizosaccharomyces japonicus yFS275]EEB05073.1 pig-W [Schizosaccharomyces japonicus yFS275]